jgi:hypothetical protein
LPEAVRRFARGQHVVAERVERKVAQVDWVHCGRVLI